MGHNRLGPLSRGRGRGSKVDEPHAPFRLVWSMASVAMLRKNRSNLSPKIDRLPLRLAAAQVRSPKEQQSSKENGEILLQSKTHHGGLAFLRFLRNCAGRKNGGSRPCWGSGLLFEHRVLPSYPTKIAKSSNPEGQSNPDDHPSRQPSRIALGH